MRRHMPTNEMFDYKQELINEIEKMTKKPYNNQLYYLELTNHRQVYSIVNGLKVFFNDENNVIGDFDIGALALLEYISMKDPKLYDYMAYNSNRIVDAYNLVNSKKYVGEVQIADNSIVSSSLGSNDKIIFKDEAKLDCEDNYVQIIYEFLKIIYGSDNFNHSTFKKEYIKYFKYAMLPKEYSKAQLLEAIDKKCNDIIMTNLNFKNEEDLIKKLDYYLIAGKTNEFDFIESKQFMMKWQLKLLYKIEDIDSIMHSKDYYINDFNNFENIKEFKDVIAEVKMNDIQVIIYIWRLCENPTSVAYDPSSNDSPLNPINSLIDLAFDRFDKIAEDQQKFYETYYYMLNLVWIHKQNKENSIESNNYYFEKIKKYCDRYFPTDILKFIKPFISPNNVPNNRRPCFLETNLFTPIEWLAWFPKRTEDQNIQMVKTWLEEMHNDTEGFGVNLEYDKIFGLEPKATEQVLNAWQDDEE